MPEPEANLQEVASASDPNRRSLAIFGPPALYGWIARRLLDHAPDPPDLSSESMRLLKQALRKLPQPDEKERPHSILSLEYSTLVNCLSEADFASFVNDVLEQAGLPYVLDNSQLRRMLVLQFGDEFYLPADGPLRSLQAALGQSEEAGRAPALCARTVEPVRRYEAVVQIHSGVDRTLIYAERLLDLLLEFLVQLCNHYTVGDDSDLGCPRYCLGPRNVSEPNRGKCRCEWGIKHESLGKLARLLSESLPTTAWACLTSFLREWAVQLDTSRSAQLGGAWLDTEFEYLTASEIMDRLRQIRNDLRHPPAAVSTCQEPPEPYTSRVVPLQRLLEALARRNARSPVMPVTVRVLRVSRDRLGFWRVLMAVEDGERAEALFTDLARLNERTYGAVRQFIDAEDDAYLVDVARHDHFLFPPPDETRSVVNPLIVERLIPPSQAGQDLMQLVLESPQPDSEPDLDAASVAQET